VSERRRGLASRRFAVVSTGFAPGTNEVWEAARLGVGALTIIGGRPQGGRSDLGEHEVGLRELDLGKGLVWRHLVGLRRRLRALRPDLVHVNAELWAVTAQELCSLDVPIVVHGAENLWHHGNRVEQALRVRLVARAADRIAGYASWNHAGAEHVRGLRKRRGLPPVPSLVLPAIIPPAEFRARRWSPPPLTPGTTLEILLVGQVIPYKGFDIAIDAAAAISARPVRITMCGTGSMAPALIARAARRGVELVHRGWLPSSELVEIMARSHVQIQPSLTTADWAEQFGRSVAEAMAVGLPCLVSTSGELPSVVGQDPRAIFPEGDVEALTRHVNALSEAPHLLDALSTDQRRLAQRYEPENAGSLLLDFWADCLS
jgi:glycosyltransferase involved in cell wall biosynthesis